MAGRSNIISASGATVAISATLPATYDSSGYGATTITYTAIGKIESLGTHGMTANVSSLTPVDTATVTKIKGAKDYGVMTLVMGSYPLDAGQVILLAASESNNHYSIKLTYPDGEIHYIDVIVTKFEYADGSVDDILKVNCDMAICRKPVVVAAP